MGNTEKVYFSVAIVLSDMEMHSNSACMKFWRSRLFSDFGQRSLVCFLSTVLKDFSTSTTGLISAASRQRGKKYMSRSHDQSGHHAHIC